MASVLAMMFVVLFGSLSVAMAIVAKGNLRTAHTHLHVMRAMGAAETGLAVAARRLEEAAGRFMIARGQVDGELSWRLWSWDPAPSSSDGVVRLPPMSGYTEPGLPLGISMALVHIHSADQNIVDIAGVPEFAGLQARPSDVDPDVYRASHWVLTPPVAVDGAPTDRGEGPAAFQITYAPLANGTDVRIIVTGYSSVTQLGSGYHYNPNPMDRRYRPLSRTISQDFRIVKRHDHAILSPSRIMIGKNVLVDGKLGARYTDVEQEHGHPIVIRSDFYGLDPILDVKLERFFENLAQFDIDGDNRLRVGHAVEGQGIPPPGDFNGDGTLENAFADVTRDGYVDEFDIFINHYDADGDGRVTLSEALTAGTPAQGRSPEFTADDDLALLIDSAMPDRNRNGISGWVDLNGNGRWDPGEPLADYDPRTEVFRDQQLGWRDGFIDRKDAYAKVRGKLVFQATQQAWQDAQGNIRDYIRGPISTPSGDGAMRFNAPEQDLPPLTAASFSDAQMPLRDLASGAAFSSQVAEQLGIAPSQLSTYVEANPSASAPRFWRADLDTNYVHGLTGRHLYERMPFGAPGYSDWYYRPRYENMTFRDVQIPMGTNALFINCTFVGSTYVRSHVANTHPNWSLYGKMEWDDELGRPMPITDPLDRSDFQRYYSGNPADGPANYEQFPEPPVFVAGQPPATGDARNTKLYSNNIRFHDCLFVGSVVGDTPQEYWHVRNKLQFTGSTRFTTQHPESPNDPTLNPSAAALEEIEKSTLMLPNYSVDIGSFNSPTDTFAGGPTAQDVRLNGTIVAGVLDIRGNAVVDGTLLLTFAPVAGQGPLQQFGIPIGNPASFNATIGYFGPEDGDGESLDPESLPIVNGQRIVGWDLDGDGIADVGPDQPQPPGGEPVPFYGYGRVELNWNPDRPMPDGIILPLRVTTLSYTYREGRR